MFEMGTQTHECADHVQNNGIYFWKFSPLLASWFSSCMVQEQWMFMPWLGSVDQFVHLHLSSNVEHIYSWALALSVVTHISSWGTHGMLNHRPVQDNENCGYETYLSHPIPHTGYSKILNRKHHFYFLFIIEDMSFQA